MKKTVMSTTLLLAMAVLAAPLQAADYDIDTKGAHAFIQFKIKHLGYSWLLGRFNKFDGQFSYDEKKPNASKVEVNIDTASLDSNHAERDKHLRSKDFLDVGKYPTAKFVSTSFQQQGQGQALLKGNLTLHGVTKPVTISVKHIGQGAAARSPGAENQIIGAVEQQHGRHRRDQLRRILVVRVEQDDDVRAGVEPVLEAFLDVSPVTEVRVVHMDLDAEFSGDLDGSIF